MQNSYLQSFGSHQQHQQNTPYFQNQILIERISTQGINLIGFLRVTQTIIRIN